MKNFREIRRILYRLKREWGKPVTVKAETYGVDYRTGVQNATEDGSFTVNRAIVLPRRFTRDFTYDLSFIAANKNFTYGGFFDVWQRNIIIDQQDMQGHDIMQDNFLVIEGRVYAIKEFDKYEEGNRLLAYLITARDLEAKSDVI
jgi:hypothetical protein